MSDYAHPEVLVTTDWVQANLGKSGVCLVEVDVDTQAYDAGHIPSAVGFNWQTQLQDQLTRDIISKEAFEALLSRAGISSGDTVALYGDHSNWFAAYAFWLFKMYGHADVRLMNGGRAKWLSEKDRPLTAEKTVRPATRYRAAEVVARLHEFSPHGDQMHTLQTWPARDDLLAHLARADCPHLLIGADAERPKKFYTLCPDLPPGQRIEIGIIATGHGIDPSCIALCGGQRLAVGHDLSVTVIDTVARTLVASTELDSVFYQFLPTAPDTQFIVCHEIGVMRLDAAGRELWSVSADILADVQARPDGTLLLRQWEDGKLLIVDSRSGKVLREKHASWPTRALRFLRRLLTRRPGNV